MADVKDKLKQILPLLLVIIAIIGFVSTALWTQNAKLTDTQRDFQRSQRALEEVVTAQGEKLVVREASIRSLGQDLEDQRKTVGEMEQQLNTVRQNMQRKVEELEARVGYGEEASRQLKSLTQRLQQYETAYAAIYQQMQIIQNHLASQGQQIAKLQEDLSTRRSIEALYQSNAPLPPSPQPSSQPPVSSPAGMTNAPTDNGWVAQPQVLTTK